MTGIQVWLYDFNDEMVGEPFLLPQIPFPGLIILYEGVAWEVLSVQAIPAHPRSFGAKTGEPLMVEIRCMAGEGIHDPDLEPK